MSEQPVERPAIRGAVTTKELREALAPFLDLLGVTAGQVYAEPPIIVGREISFWMPVTDSTESRPHGVRDTGHPLDENAELMRQIVVKIEDPE